MKPKINLLSKTEVRLNLPSCLATEVRDIVDGVGIYFVFHENDCLYIGKSKNFKSRWSNHHKLKEIVSYTPTPLIYFLYLSHEPANLKFLESQYIKTFNPLLNDPKRSMSGEKEINRFQITLPELSDYRLKAWAHLKGMNRATLAGFLVQDEIEDSWDNIDKNLDALAKLRKITRQELDI
jgi:GIY-YIG catalytic domain